MAGLRRTGTILVIALIPYMAAGCAGTGSRLAKWRGPNADSQEQTWALAQQCEREGRLAEARELYSQLYRADTESAKYVHRLGVVRTMLGEHEKAAVAYRRAIELDPGNPELLADAGYASYLQKNYVEAERLLRASLAIVAENPRAASNLALAVGFQGRYDECHALFRQVHGQDEVEILCNLAYVRAQRGEFKDAAGLYKQALTIDPAAKKAIAALAQLKVDERSATIAQEKPYRKYMPGKQQPAVAAAKTPVPATQPDVALVKPVAKPVVEQAAVVAKPAAIPKNALKPAAALKGEVVLTAQSAADEEDLTGWTAENEVVETPVENIPRGFPEAAASENSSAPQALKPVQTVTSDESPFAVVEAPATDGAPAALDEPHLDAFEQPQELIGDWAAAPGADLDRFSPEAQAARQAQIAERSGQSGFMSFCPVALRDEVRLVDVQPQFSAEHQSQSYQFSSEAAQKKFEANPERYLPAAGGLDVVAVSQGTAVAQGSLEHALWFRHKLYLFLNAENRELFRQQAKQFAVQQ